MRLTRSCHDEEVRRYGCHRQAKPNAWQADVAITSRPRSATLRCRLRDLQRRLQQPLLSVPPERLCPAGNWFFRRWLVDLQFPIGGGLLVGKDPD